MGARSCTRTCSFCRCVCAAQHGTGTSATLIAAHPYRARFEARYGAQLALLAECIAMLTNQEATTTMAAA
jgi:hypothetical protein